jgi:hypothetical protein
MCGGVAADFPPRSPSAALRSYLGAALREQPPAVHAAGSVTSPPSVHAASAPSGASACLFSRSSAPGGVQALGHLIRVSRPFRARAADDRPVPNAAAHVGQPKLMAEKAQG